MARGKPFSSLESAGRSLAFSSFRNARARCTSPRDKKYKWYGGRGIQFRFATFDAFFAELGPRPWHKTIDRIDNNGHYEAGNVRWATRKEQSLNRSKSMTSKRKRSVDSRAANH